VKKRLITKHKHTKHNNISDTAKLYSETNNKSCKRNVWGVWERVHGNMNTLGH